MAKKNSVTMKMIQEDYNKYNETFDIEFERANENGEMKTYTIQLYPYFKPERITKVLENIKKDVTEIEKHDELKLSNELMPIFVIYHAILEFTNLPKPLSKNIEKRISHFQQFINTDYFKMVEEHLIQSEMDKVWDSLMSAVIANEKINRMHNKIQNLNLQSPELKAHIQKRIPEA